MTQSGALSTPSAPSPLLVALALAAAIVGWMALHRGPPASLETGATRGVAAKRAPAGAQAGDPGAFALVPPPRRVVPPGRLFAPSEPSGAVPASPPSAAGSAPAPAADSVPPAPATQTPQAPPLPFAFLGRLGESGRWTVLVGRGNAQVVAREGDVIDGQWQVEAIDEAGIAFVYLPLGMRQRLQFTAGEAPGITQVDNDTTARTSGHATPGLETAPGPSAGGTAQPLAISAAGRAGASEAAGEQPALRTPPPAFERRVRPSDIPREPWVCEAARANALVPCRNTWSMSEAERVACRRAAEQRYNACRSAAAQEPEG